MSSVLKTVAYCDIDTDCVQVIRSNISKGLLDRAPVLGPVQSVTRDMLPVGIQVITAGFPCQDLSTAGNKAGIYGERTGLFMHIMQLLESLNTVKYVFLENVPAIMNGHVDVVTDHLCKLGFTCAYGLFQANEEPCARPHTRKRWFLLGLRDIANTPPPRQASHVTCPVRPPVRLIAKGPRSSHDRVRYRMLGNSVVPQTVVRAWNTLSTALSGREREVTASLSALRSVKIVGPGWDSTIRRELTLKYLSVPLTLPGGIIKRVWATPTAQYNHAFTVFNTNRGFDNLFNQIYYDRRTAPGVPRPKLLETMTVNPAFVEWLMGYPRNYTAKE